MFLWNKFYFKKLFSLQNAHLIEKAVSLDELQLHISTGLSFRFEAGQSHCEHELTDRFRLGELKNDSHDEVKLTIPCQLHDCQFSIQVREGQPLGEFYLIVISKKINFIILRPISWKTTVPALLVEACNAKDICLSLQRFFRQSRDIFKSHKSKETNPSDEEARAERNVSMRQLRLSNAVPRRSDKAFDACSHVDEKNHFQVFYFF